MRPQGPVLRAALAGLLLAVVAACTPAGAPTGGSPTVPPVGTGAGQTDAPIYLVSGEDGSPFAEQPIAWADLRAVIVSATPRVDPADLEPSRLPFVPGAVKAGAFLSRPGEERNRSSWVLWADLYDLGGQGSNLGNATPGDMVNGQQPAVLATGGAYSLGIAYVGESGQDVTAAFFTTIEVTPTTGDFTFATPAGQ